MAARQWNTEVILGAFRRRLRGRLLAFGILVLLCGAACGIAFVLSSQRYLDPVPEFLKSSDSSLRAQVSWLREMRQHRDVHPKLKSRYEPSIREAQGYLQSLAAVRKDLLERNAPSETEFLDPLAARLGPLRNLGLAVDLDSRYLDALEGQLVRAKRSFEQERTARQATAEDRKRNLQKRIAAVERRIERQKAKGREWVRKIDGLARQGFNSRSKQLGNRHMFLRRFQAYWASLSEPALRVWLSAAEAPPFLKDLARLSGRVDQALLDAPARERQAALKALLPELESSLSRRLEAEVQLLGWVDQAAQGNVELDSESQRSVVERSAGLLANDGDLALLRSQGVRERALNRARGFRAEWDGLAADLDPWTYLVRLAQASVKVIADDELEYLPRWVAVLEQAHEQGLIEEDQASDLRLAHFVRLFGLKPGRGWIRYLEALESSGAYDSLAESRPFSVAGTLVKVMHEVLETKRTFIASKKGELARWEVLVRKLFKTLVDVDRSWGQAALAASEPMNRGEGKGSARADAFRRHASRQKAFEVRGGWNEDFRRLPQDSDPARIGAGVFQMMLFLEREIEKSLRGEAIDSLTREGVPRVKLSSAMSDSSNLEPLTWDAPPESSVLVTAKEVEGFLELGVEPTALGDWASRYSIGAPWKDGFRVALLRSPLEANLVYEPPRYQLALAAYPQGDLEFEVELFAYDSADRYRELIYLAAGCGVVLLLAGLLLFRRKSPSLLIVEANDEGVASLKISGEAGYSTARLKDAGTDDVLLEWRRDHRKKRNILRVHRNLPPYELRYKKQKRGRTGAQWVLERRPPEITGVSDEEFTPEGQRIVIHGLHLTRRCQVFLGEVDVSEHIVAEESSFVRLVVLLPDSTGLSDGVHELAIMISEGDAPMSGGPVILGRARLARCDLPAFFFTSEGAQSTQAHFTLEGDRGDAIRIWRQGPEGPRESISWKALPDAQGPGTRTITASLDLPLGRQKLEIDTSTATLARTVWVFDRQCRVVTALVRESGGALRLERRLMMDGTENASGGILSQSLGSSARALGAALLGSDVLVLTPRGLLRWRNGAEEERPQILSGDFDVAEGYHYSFARKGNRIHVAVTRAEGMGRLFYWDLGAPSRRHEIEWIDGAFREIGNANSSILYILHNGLYDLDDPESGAGGRWRRSWRLAAEKPAAPLCGTESLVRHRSPVSLARPACSRRCGAREPGG